MLARVTTFAVDGLAPRRITVEVDVRPGLPAFTIVGCADGAVRESRERVRAAVLNSGFRFPGRRVTVNLAPAHLRKIGPGFDLATACGVLAASDQMSPADLERWAIFGELSLGGELRGCPGVLVVAEGAQRGGLSGLVVPRDCAAEAELVDGLAIAGAGSLAEVAAILCGEDVPRPSAPVPPRPGAGREAEADLADVRGHAPAIHSLKVAAAGGHNLLLSGPPGTGKTMLARRLPSILPALTRAEALEVTRIHSIAGQRTGHGLLERRPLRAPHHTVSAAGLVGGGSVPRAGEVSLAHRGVLLLDELSEFARAALEALRQPLEDGRVAIVRGQRTVVFPAAFMLVATTNPCPCGLAGTPRCRCGEADLARHRRRLSGPLMDRIDLLCDVQAPSAEELSGDGVTTSAEVRAQVAEARERQAARLVGTRVRTNAELTPRLVRELARVDADALDWLRGPYTAGGLSARGHHRVLRVARTVADLARSDRVRAEHVRKALSMRRPDEERWGQAA